jgi:hypothetical protein
MIFMRVRVQEDALKTQQGVIVFAVCLVVATRMLRALGTELHDLPLQFSDTFLICALCGLMLTSNLVSITVHHILGAHLKRLPICFGLPAVPVMNLYTLSLRTRSQSAMQGFLSTQTGDLTHSFLNLLCKLMSIERWRSMTELWCRPLACCVNHCKIKF